MSRKPKIFVIGAGINGRMIQHLIPDAQILDWGATPESVPRPRFYGANYLWRPVPGLPYRKFMVRTLIDGETPTIDGVRAYKSRIGKEHEVRTHEDQERVLSTQFVHWMQGYELIQYPVAFIRYNCHVQGIDLDNHRMTLKTGEVVEYDYLASTIPLPALLAMADIRVHGVFRSQPIRVRVLRAGILGREDSIDVDYITDTTVPEYRRTTRFGERHDETLEHKFPGDDGEFHRLVPGKIWDTPRSLEFTDVLAHHDVVTFGRYGSWNSDELVHNTLQRIAGWALMEGLEVSEHVRDVA